VTPPDLDVQGVRKQYGAVAAVRDASLALTAGEVLTLLGPSGCGKSTLLRVIAGLERPDAGRVLMRDVDVTREPPERRNLSLVFQDYALFPHLNVLGNVTYGLRARGASRRDAEQVARDALNLVGLTEFGSRRVHELSGGQQQRVALARALAPRPRLLLLDEPLSNLDERLRANLQLELRDLFTRLGMTVLLVTHDQREALALSDRIALMREGRVVQIGATREVYARPATAWAAQFLGHRNVVPHPRGRLLIPEDAIVLGEGSACPVLGVHPTDRGARVTVAHPLGALTLSLSAREARLVTDDLRLRVREDACHVLPDDLT